MDQGGAEVGQVLVRRLLAQVGGAVGEGHRVAQEGRSLSHDGCQGGLELLTRASAFSSSFLELRVCVALPVQSMLTPPAG